MSDSEDTIERSRKSPKAKRIIRKRALSDGPEGGGGELTARRTA